MGLLALALLISVTGQARGQSPFTEKEVLTSNGGEAGDQFGYSVDLDGHVAVIGARRERTGTGSGTVYVHRFNGSTWPMEAGLVASDGRGSDWFGCSVAVSGNVVVVGADHNDEMGPNSGAVYVYRRIDCSWVEEQIIRANDSMPSSFFGCSVSVSGDVMVIGAYGSDYTGDLSGAVDVYRHDGIQWLPEQRLVPNDNTGGDRLGISVSVSDDVIIAGASTDDHRDIDAGSAYVFRFDGTTWVEEQKLVASNPFRYSQFGRSVSVSGDVALSARRIMTGRWTPAVPISFDMTEIAGSKSSGSSRTTEGRKSVSAVRSRSTGTWL